MSIITLFSAFMGLYVIVRIILPSGMNWPLKLILSLFALACAEKLLLTKLVYGTMGAFMPEPVQLASGYLHSAVTILFLLLVARDALLLLTWPFRRSTGRQRKIFYGHKEKKPASGFWAFTLVLLALALSGYGMREALRVPPVREVRMQVPGLPDALNGFRIAQLSDLQISSSSPATWWTAPRHALKKTWPRWRISKPSTASSLRPAITSITPGSSNGCPFSSVSVCMCS